MAKGFKDETLAANGSSTAITYKGHGLTYMVSGDFDGGNVTMNASDGSVTYEQVAASTGNFIYTVPSTTPAGMDFFVTLAGATESPAAVRVRTFESKVIA